MSKTDVKKKLQGMEKERIIKLLFELYDARKEAKQYLDFWAKPDSNALVEDYKKIIRNEFYPGGRKEPQTRFSVCRKAISDFKKMKPASEAMADLMVSYMEYACEFCYDYGDMWEQYYISVEGNFEKMLIFVMENGLYEQFRPRILQCLAWADTSGWGFPDTLHQLYDNLVFQYFGKDK